MKLFLDIVAFGNTKEDLANALEHAVDQLRLGTRSESVNLETGSGRSYGAFHVTYDIRDTAHEPWKSKAEAYLGD